MDTMAYCVDSVVEGGEEGIFTPGWWFICRNTGEAIDEKLLRGEVGEDGEEQAGNEGDVMVVERITESKVESRNGSPSKGRSGRKK